MNIATRSLPPLKIPSLGFDGVESVHATTPFPILGIDGSVGKAGFCLMHKGRFVAWKHQIKPSEGPTRLRAWRTYMNRLLRELEIKHVVLEGYSYGSRNTKAQSTGEIGGIFRLAASDAGARVLVASPNTVKMMATGKGNSPKTAIPLGLYKKFSFDMPDEDEADAAALAMIGRAIWHPELCNTPKTLLKTLEKVEHYIP